MLRTSEDVSVAPTKIAGAYRYLGQQIAPFKEARARDTTSGREHIAGLRAQILEHIAEHDTPFVTVYVSVWVDSAGNVHENIGDAAHAITAAVQLVEDGLLSIDRFESLFNIQPEKFRSREAAIKKYRARNKYRKQHTKRELQNTNVTTGDKALNALESVYPMFAGKNVIRTVVSNTVRGSIDADAFDLPPGDEKTTIPAEIAVAEYAEWARHVAAAQLPERVKKRLTGHVMQSVFGRIAKANKGNGSDAIRTELRRTTAALLKKPTGDNKYLTELEGCGTNAGKFYKFLVSELLYKGRSN